MKALALTFLLFWSTGASSVVFIGAGSGGGGFDPGSTSPNIWVTTTDNNSLWTTTAKAAHPSVQGSFDPASGDYVDTITNLGSIVVDLDITVSQNAIFNPAGQNGLDTATKTTSRRWESGFASFNATELTLAYCGETDSIRSVVRVETSGGTAADQIYLNNASSVGGDVGVNYNGEIILSAPGIANAGWHCIVVYLNFTNMTGKIWVDGVLVDEDVTTGTAGSVDIDFFSIYRGATHFGEAYLSTNNAYQNNKADFDTHFSGWTP